MEEIEKSKDDEEKARKSYWVAECLRWMNDDDASLKWYRQAYELSKNQVSLEAYAGAALRTQQYSNAKPLFAKLIQDYGQNESWKLALESCDAALVWMKEQDPNLYIIRKAKYNSQQSDYSPVYFEDVLVFTSDRDESRGDTYHWTGRQYADFYRNKENVRLDDLLYKINSPFNEASITFNQHLSHAIYTQCGSGNDESDIQRCRLIEGKWDERDETWASFQKLPFCKDEVNYGHPTFFNQDKGIIFSSNDADGYGGHDLWISYQTDNSWSNPVLLPKGINTAGEEKFPVMQGDTLFYSSNGKIGMGGMDLYFTKWISPDGWTTPQNLMPPINSGGDDFGFVYDPTFKSDANTINRFLITSNRKGSQQDDIYIFEKKKTFQPQDTVVVEDKYEIVIEGKVLEHVYEIEGDPNSRKMGTRPLANASVVVNEEDIFPPSQTMADGEFRYVISDEGAFRFIANKEGYLANSHYIDIVLDDNDRRVGGKTFLVHIVLDPIIYNTEIVLKDIYYDFDKWDIRTDAEPSLTQLANLLSDNPEIKIELASHTDCRGLEIYNAELSQRRAQSAVTFLESLGIERRRMKPAGYGEQKPAVACSCDSCSEEEHQANRRTSFTILKD